jgi:predicted transcriptional regulator
MEDQKRDTVKIMRQRYKVPPEVKENLKEFSKIKNAILKSLEKEDLTISELCDKIPMPKEEMVYYLLSLVKFGFVKTGDIDGLDEYYKYRLR